MGKGGYSPPFLATLLRTPESKYWVGSRCKPYSNYWGGYSQIIGGDISPRSPPGFGTPVHEQRILVCKSHDLTEKEQFSERELKSSFLEV